MALSRWQPFNPVWGQLHQLQNELNRLFDRWGMEGNEGPTTTSYPAVNLWEEG